MAQGREEDVYTDLIISTIVDDGKTNIGNFVYTDLIISTIVDAVRT